VVFPFPKVFQLIRNGSTSRTPPLIIDSDGNLDDIIVYSLAIALLTPSPFCVTCLSRLAFEYCRQRYLCTLVIIDPPFHCIYTISYWYHHIIPCVTRLFPHIHNCYLGLCIVPIQKKRIKLLSKKRKTKKLVSKRHSIASYDIILDHLGSSCAKSTGTSYT